MRWRTAWQLVRDVLMTGAGLTLIFLQEFSEHPSDLMVSAGLILLAPAGVTHAVGSALSQSQGIQPGPSASSSPSSSAPSPASSRSPEHEP